MSTQDTTDQSFKCSKAWSKAIFRSHNAPKAGTPATTSTTSTSPTPHSSTPSSSEHSKKHHGHHSSLLTACIAVFRPHHTSSKPGPEIEIEDEIEDGGAQEQELLPVTDSNDSSPSSSFNSEYFSKRIQEMIERRTEFATELEAEIAASKDHWSELRPSVRVSETGELETGELEAGETDEEIFRSLKQWPIFRWGDADNLEVGAKLAEGAQAEVFEGEWRNPDGSETPPWVLKVYKEGSSLRDLQRQWPRGIFERGGQQYGGTYVCSIFGGLLLNDGRFAFRLWKHWGDLRKLIDLRMQHTRNRSRPPFTDYMAQQSMLEIARGMRGLHKDGIIHRDLKASNVLIETHSVSTEDLIASFEPSRRHLFTCSVADFECSVGVVGTGFWRAPEILLAVKNHDVHEKPHLFTQKADVYSYAMTCYEILTSRIPFEGTRATDYDVVLRGDRPKLPTGTKRWIATLLSRCWHPDPSERPMFEEIVETIQTSFKDYSGY